MIISYKLLKKYLYIVLSNAKCGLKCFYSVTKGLLAFDWIAFLFVASYLVIFIFTIGRHANDALLLATFYDDDALISQQLDGMSVWPYGNPGTYLDPTNSSSILPDYWSNLTYHNLPYYGGFYLDIAFLIWFPLKLAGLPFFPTAPLVLRSVSLMFTVFTILAGYNFSRINFGRLTAIFATLLLFTDYYLSWIGTVIHPDSMLFFLSIVALAICIRHVRMPDTPSVVALGVAVGLVQGTKMGALLIAPIVLISVFIGVTCSDKTRSALLKDFLFRIFIIGVVSLFVFFITTPYAFIDKYFFNVWLLWSKVFTGTSPISSTSFIDWWNNLKDYIGTPILLMSCSGAILSIFIYRSCFQKIVLILTLIFGIWVFLYYALLQRYWVQLQYLVISYWICGLFASILVSTFLTSPILKKGWYLRWITTPILVFALTILFLYRVQPILLLAYEYSHWRMAPQFMIGRWASANIPIGSTIISDAPTYFKSNDFPQYKFLAAPIRYVDLLREKPDYFLITRYTGNWQVEKIERQSLDHWDQNAFNLSLYQDLLGAYPTNIRLNTDSTNFVSHIKSYGWSNNSNLQKLNYDCTYPFLTCISQSIPDLNKISEQAERMVSNARHVSLFKFDYHNFLKQIPIEFKSRVGTPFASSTAPEAPATNAFIDGLGGNWRSSKVGLNAQGEYIGIVLPDGAAISPSEVIIRWVAWHWCPETIVIEYSDDGIYWRVVGKFTVAQPTDIGNRMNGSNRWQESYKFSNVGSHRFWRVKAETIPETNYFGLEWIGFR